MDRFRIVGPNRIVGQVRASGAKNASLPAMAASLLTDEPLTLTRLPRVRDIATMQKLLLYLGVEVVDREGSLKFLPTAQIANPEAPYELVKKMRASILVLGPLVARRGEARVSLPGGCAIGVRPIDQHLQGLAALGAEVELEHGYVTIRAPRLRGAHFRFDLNTVTGTENLLMAACLASGTTRLENCAREPEVVDLARLLTKMGAKIDGAGSETITIEGVETLNGARHEVIPDRIEGGTYLIAAALTGGEVLLQDAREAHLAPLLRTLQEAGAEVTVTDEGIHLSCGDEIRPRDVVTSPYPGFATDLQAQYLALMTHARGQATICETVFENRFQHVPELRRMGAEIHVEGNRAQVLGPRELSGAHVMATDLRASACLVLAALKARGETIVHRIYHLDRGYEHMELKLQELGARVERLRGKDPQE